jgi:hypothetical protein
MDVDYELMIDFGLVVLIWLVQAIIYPGFRHLDAASFVAVHKKYEGVISIFVIPLMTAQLAIKVLDVYQEQQSTSLTSLALVLIIWAATFFLAVPCHRRLDEVGKDPRTIARLVLANWIRTLGWTAILGLTLAARHWKA